MKIYTKTGDQGETGLLGTERVSKTSDVIEAIGAVDELNSILGWVTSAGDVFPSPGSQEKVARRSTGEGGTDEVDSPSPSPRGGEDFSPGVDLTASVHRIQKLLFDLGGELAQAQEINRSIRSISETDIHELEQQMDAITEQLPPLRNFILPGGTELAARLHIARSVCRRAEREVLRFHAQHPLRTELPIFLNRLSDWCFVMARWANHCADRADILWTQ